MNAEGNEASILGIQTLIPVSLHVSINGAMFKPDLSHVYSTRCLESEISRDDQEYMDNGEDVGARIIHRATQC